MAAQVTNWNRAEVECRGIIRGLAEMMVVCPACRGASIEGGYCDGVGTVGWKPCPTCSTGPGVFQGQVARFPWLRLYSPLSLSGLWVPNENILLEQALAAMGSGYTLQVLADWRDHLPLAIGTTPSDVRLTFWQAVEKIVAP